MRGGLINRVAMRRGATVFGLSDTAGTGMLPSSTTFYSPSINYASRNNNEFRNTTNRPMETAGVYMIERRVI